MHGLRSWPGSPFGRTTADSYFTVRGRSAGTLYLRTISGPTMRVLFLHVDYLEYEVKEKALKSAPDIPASKRRERVEEALVSFVSAEKRDEGNLASVAKVAAENGADVAGQRHTKRVVRDPYAHSRSSLAAPGPAQELIPSLEKERVARDFECHAC